MTKELKAAIEAVIYGDKYPGGHAKHVELGQAIAMLRKAYKAHYLA